jgi:hypothetical protein
MKSTTNLQVLIFAAIATAVWSADVNNIQDEIARIRKEFAQVQTERARNRQEADRDRSEQEAYGLRIKTHRSSVEAETDSVKREIARTRAVGDSLRATLESIRNKQRQYDLLQNQFHLKMVESCDTFIEMARRMPPLAGATIVSSISFLKAELSGKAVDNVEALQRLEQMVRDLHEATMSLQDLQAAPPVPEIKTTASVIRLGAVFQAAAAEKGTMAALWQGSDNNGNPRWTIERNPTIAKAVFDAVAMRQGKALPAIVLLPFGAPAPATEGAK